MEIETIAFLTILNSLLIIALYVANHRIRKKSYQRQLKSIKVNASLKAILVNIQKQRGLSLRFINGEQSLDKDIKLQMSNIDRDISSIEHAHSDILDNDDRWSAIRQQWADLKQQVMTLETEKSYIKHCMLIEELIFMIGDVADRGQNEAKTIVNDDESKVIWVNIPQTLEALGKTRAIGSGVASAGSCSQANKIKLRYLSDEINKNYQQISQQLVNLSKENALQSPQQITQKVDDLLSSVSQHLILPETPDVSAESFFKQATNTMDSLSSLFDQLTHSKEQQLTRILD